MILFWGFITLLSGGLAYYFMGSFAQPILISGSLAALLGFSLGHFLNRGRKQAFILAPAACLGFVFLFGWLTTQALQQEQNFIFPDALAHPPRNVYFLTCSAQLTGTVLVLLLFLFFIKPIYLSFQKI